MTRSPDSLIPSFSEQLLEEKRSDKAFKSRLEGEANSRAATQVNAVSASSTPPAINPIEPEHFPGRACPLKAKPATDRKVASEQPVRRDGVQGGGTRRQDTKITGETRRGPACEQMMLFTTGREAYKGSPRKRGTEATPGVGDGHSTCEPRENRGEGRAVTSAKRSKRGKTAGLPPRGKAPSRPKPPKRLDPVRKLQRTLYRAAKSHCDECRRTKAVGEPDAGKPHVRFDEGVQETYG